MALGKRQLETIGKCVDIAKRSPDIIRLQVIVGKQRAYTREFGSGISITLKILECYEEGEYVMSAEWIADCSYEYTAIEKGQEIARYLVDQGVPKDRVQLGQK